MIQGQNVDPAWLSHVIKASSGLATLVVGVGGWLFAWVQYRERRTDAATHLTELRDSRIFEALKWFEGTTQKRNIGIAVLEGFWEEVPHLRGVLVPLVVNQTIYLLTQSKQEEAQHERDNLERLLELIKRYGDLSGQFPNQRLRLKKAFEDRRAKAVAGSVSTGVTASPAELTKWQQEVRAT